MPFSRLCSHTQFVTSSRLGRFCLSGAVALLVSVPLFPQPLASVWAARKSEKGVPRVIRADVRLVLLSAIVTDRKGVIVNGLTQDNFTILEDKVPQPILAFSSEEVPCSVGVVLDLSGSMRDKLPAATAAVRAFLKTANPEDESFMMAVASRPESLLNFTDDVGTLQNSLRTARAEGSTALIDTIYLGLNRMRSARNARRALLIVSDGMDNNSRYSKSELLRTVQEQDVQIYTIGIAERPAGKKAIQLMEEARGLALLGDLADLSGGMSFTVVNSDGILPAASKIGQAVREQYVIGYRQSDRDDSGKWHAVQLKINPPQLKVYGRKGYYSH
jgi:Ca-activated chloride channel family protein